MSDTLQIFGKTFSNATGIVATDNTDTERTFIRPTGTMTIDENGTYDVSEYASAEVSVSGSGDEPVPEDGKTRIWIHIAEGTPDNRLTFYLRFTASVANNTTVDWGDGTTETLGSTTATNYSHTYPSGGDYIITLTVNTGTISFEGDSTNKIYGRDAAGTYYLRSRIRRIIFGDNVTEIGNYACNYCIALASVVISDSITKIGDYAFLHADCIETITLPDSITEIGQSAFSTCASLSVVIISDNVTNIKANTFAYNTSALEYHFKPTTPPSLASTNVFTSIQSNCIIYVPQGSLNAYKTATNWSSFASKMQEEPA